MSETRRKSREQIEGIFYPRSVAVVGTNRVKRTVPYDIFFNILKDNFQGTVFPVSPKEKSIAGVKAYKYVIDIEDEVDMAILVFPSSVCHLAMEQCGKKGIRSAVIISAGFREVGEEGLARERQLKEIADRYGISFIGPNCLGVINTDPVCSLNASFARMMPDEGNIAFLSQSGALCTAVLDYARAQHIGFSKFVSFGNKADVTEIDLLHYLKDDSKTKVILLYLEEVTDGQSLMQAAREIIRESGKPVLVLKAGRTREGAAAAASHTGSLAGSDAVCDAAFRQAGIIRCDTVEDMFNYAIALAYQPVPRDNRVAIITNAGGPGVLATDRAVQEQLRLASFSEQTVKTLRKSLPRTANLKNPVDVIGDAKVDRYRVALTSVLQDSGVDGALVILTPQSMTDITSIAEEICSVTSQQDKPVYTTFMGQADVSAGVEILQRRSIPHYSLPEDMCKAFARAWLFRSICRRLQAAEKTEPMPLLGADHTAARSLLERAVGEGRRYLLPPDAFRLLETCRLPVLAYDLSLSAEEAAKAARRIGFPVALKAISDDIPHKTEAGAVILNVKTEKHAERAYRTLLENVGRSAPGAAIDGVLVQKMAGEGEEMILGLKRDPSFGMVIMVGLGGVFVELFREVSFRVLPFEAGEAEEMVRELRFLPLLTGMRGRKERDIGGLVGCIRRLAALALECPGIEELDINPLLVRDRGLGCAAADVRITLRDGRRDR